MLSRRRFLQSVSASVFAAPRAAEAQVPGKGARIGTLSLGSVRGPFTDSFKQGLRELGYIEGQNISIVSRSAEGRAELLPALAAELVGLKVDIIVAGSQAAVAAKQATSSIPIVMPIITDPVGLGLVASLARPGGNATGFATQNDELPGKWMQLVKETRPKALRVAVMWDPAYGGALQLKAAEDAARSLRMRVHAVKVEALDDFASAFAALEKDRPEALIVSSSALFFFHRARLIDFAAKQLLPTVYHQSDFVVASGGLMSYGPDFSDLSRRSARVVDKILKGAKPADLPVEQPTKFELAINLRTAKALGLTIPPSLLLRADQIIE